jgi:RNA polymerase sigma-70 factor (family 1)
MPENRDNDILLKGLFDSYFGHLVIYAKRIVKSEAVAEDIVQEVFLNLWKKKKLQLCTPQFLYNCVKNAAINYLKTGETRYVQIPHELLGSVASDSDSFDDEIERMKQLEKLYQAIEQLPPQCREVLKEVYLKKQKYADVATQMNISVNTVRAHMYTAFKLLKTHLTPSLFLLFLRL